MNAPATDPLASLRDIHLPAPISSWIPAPGWWILALLAVAACLLVVYVRRQRQRSAQRMALRELDQLVADASGLQELATGFSELLRRAAILRLGASDVASLHGQAWEQFLRAHGENSPEPVFALLAEAPYAPQADPVASNDATREQLITATRRWILRNL